MLEWLITAALLCRLKHFKSDILIIKRKEMTCQKQTENEGYETQDLPMI